MLASAPRTSLLRQGYWSYCSPGTRGWLALTFGAGWATSAPLIRPISSTPRILAGHSHWANIKHKKGRKDEERSDRNRKLLLSIITAARVGGLDLGSNPALANAIDKAHFANISKDKIEAAIQRADTSKGGEAMEELVFQGTFAAGIGVLVEAVSDNRNRTVQEVKLVFSESGGNVVSDGFVGRMFEKKGVVEISEVTDQERDLVEESALGDLPVEDVQVDDDIMRLICAPKDVYKVKDEVRKQLLFVRGGEAESGVDVSASVYNLLKDPAGVVEVHKDEEPSLMVGKKKKETLKTRYDAYTKALDTLNALPDVKSVSHNILFVDADEGE